MRVTRLPLFCELCPRVSVRMSTSAVLLHYDHLVWESPLDLLGHAVPLHEHAREPRVAGLRLRVRRAAGVAA